MSLFDSIIGETGEKFGLSSTKSGKFLSVLLSVMTSPEHGGLGGFLQRFRSAGLGDSVDSWVRHGDNTPLSSEQIESSLGQEMIENISVQSEVDYDTTTSALATVVPQVVDKLTPDGEIPDEKDLLSRISGFLGSFGGAALGAAGVIGGAALGTAGAIGSAAGGAVGKVGDVAEATFDKGKDVLSDGIGAVGNAAGAVGDKFSGAMNSVGDVFDGDGNNGNSFLKILLPLILLGLLVALGFWFCGKSTPITAVPTNISNTNKTVSNSNTNSTAKTVDSSFKIEAKDGKYIVSGVVPDQKTLDAIKAKLFAQFGEGNVDFAGLKVDTNAKPFTGDWWSKFEQMLPSLKDWKTGSLSFIGNSIETVGELPKAALDQLKSLFGTWKLPVSIAGAETAAKQANEEALKELGEADSVDEIVKALNVSIINFASGKSDIPADAKTILEKAADVLKKQPETAVVEIGGHTDSDGNDDANLKLSQARAESVKKALVALGVKDAMLSAKGYGETKAISPNDTPDNKFKNRRIEYKTATGNSPTATTTTTNTNSTK